MSKFSNYCAALSITMQINNLNWALQDVTRGEGHHFLFCHKCIEVNGFTFTVGLLPKSQQSESSSKKLLSQLLGSKLLTCVPVLSVMLNNGTIGWKLKLSHKNTAELLLITPVVNVSKGH